VGTFGQRAKRGKARYLNLILNQASLRLKFHLNKGESSLV